MACHAAPLGADQPASAAETADQPLRRLGSEPSGSKRTVDMLIEMQPRSAGLEFNDRARPQERGIRAVPAQPQRDATAGRPQAPAVPADAAQASGLFGTGAAPVVTSRKVATGPEADWKATPGGRAVAGDASPAAHHPLQGERWALLPREVVQWVRENREWVIAGAVGLLALMWGGSMFMGRSRH